MSFIDKVRIRARAGGGGNGCVSFRREKYVEFGGPNGGDGGRGGDIALVADRNLGTLLDFAHRPHWIARDGENGKGSAKTGAGAPTLIALVPVGTVVYKDGVPLADMTRHGSRLLIARGGRGGRGNLSFKTHSNTAPRIAEKGEPGEEAVVDLELKLIADIGLVGLPNAGKSSLLACVTRAKPKIADYPFTTLSPNLGLVRHKGADFALADIPGLIEGAHAGKGLGDEFLRHVERTRLLVHLVDPLGYGERGFLDGIRTIETELKAFSKVLAAKPRVLAVSKMDLSAGPEALRRVRARFPSRKVFGFSSVSRLGLTELLDFLALESARPAGEEPAVPVLRNVPGGGGGLRGGRGAVRVARVRPGFRVLREGAGAYRIAGEAVERMAAMTNFSLPASLERFQRIMKRVGVDKALRRIGASAGDTVRFGKVEMEWVE